MRQRGEAPAPVLLSVPHAGRGYTPAILARARVPEETLRGMEDRYADLLVEDLVARGYPALVAHAPRAVIDLNRDPRDIDSRVVSGIPSDRPLIQSIKQRGGLGLFPRSLPRSGDLWRGTFPWEEALERIEQAHGPYHAMLEREMDRLSAHHGGQALLIDVHSMPPLSGTAGINPPDVVIGDRFGASAASRFSETARSIVEAHGLVAALNHPYSGFYLIERHGHPLRGRHAIQVEISRDLYLDERRDGPGPGFARIRAMLTSLAQALGKELIPDRWQEAAE